MLKYVFGRSSNGRTAAFEAVNHGSNPCLPARCDIKVFETYCYNENMKKMRPGLGIAIGIVIGIAIGAALHNIGAGIAIGVALGVAFEVTNRTKK